MSYRREHRASRSALLDGLEEGGVRATSSIDIKEHDNDKAVDSLQDRVAFLKMLTGDIHAEVESHNRMLDRMGNNMDASRGIISGTMDRFKMVFEKRSNRKMCSLVACLTTCFILLFYLTSISVFMVVIEMRSSYYPMYRHFTTRRANHSKKVDYMSNDTLNQLFDHERVEL